MFKPIFFAIFGVVAFNASFVVAAPDDLADSSSPATVTMAANAPSITSHLQLKSAQIERLNRLYDDYAARRAKLETQMAGVQNRLREAQSPEFFDEGRAFRLSREIGQARQQMADDFLTARIKAFKILSPVQRSQLESLANNDRIRVRFDRYSQLLLLPPEEAEQTFIANRDQSRITSETPRRDGYENQRQNQNRRRGTARYDVYGGYSYGRPNYGIVGSYNEGPFGAHVGVGSGGPFFGVGVGGVISRLR